MVYVIKKKDKTRQRDLDILDAAVRKSANPKAAKKRLEKVYEQTKDEDIAKLRQALIRARRSGDMNTVSRIERELTKLQRKRGL